MQKNEEEKEGRLDKQQKNEEELFKASKDQFKNAKTARNLALADLDFHKQLFRLAGNEKILKLWETEDSRELHYQIWRSIGNNTKDLDKMCDIHDAIYNSITDGNAENAIAAMYEHFAIILLYYIRHFKPTTIKQQSKTGDA